MAQVDTGIYSNLLAPVKSVQQYDIEAQQAQSGRLSNLLNQAQYDSQQKAIADEQKLSSIYQNSLNPSGAIDRSKLLGGAASSGLGYKIPILQKQLMEMDEGQAKIDNQKSITDKNNSETLDQSIKRYRGALDYIDTPQGAIRWLQAQYTDPAMAKHMQALGSLNDAIKHIPQTPAEFEQWRAQAGMGMEAYAKKVQKDQEIAETARNNKEQNRIASGQLGVAQGRLGVEQDRLNFDKTKAAKEASTGVTYQQDSQGNLVALPKNVAPGQPVASIPVMASGEQLQGKGSPKAAFGQQYGMVKSALNDVNDLLPKATASGAGAARDAVAGFFGASTDAADAAAKLDTLGGWLTSTVPRFEGPQSDKDVANYRQMAGDVANRKLPTSQRLQAAKSLEKLMDDKAKSYGLPVQNSAASRGPAGKTQAGATVSNW